MTSLFTTTLLCYISEKIWNFKSVWEKWKLLVSFPTQCFSNSSQPKGCTKYVYETLTFFSQTFIYLCFSIVLKWRRDFFCSLGEKSLGGKNPKIEWEGYTVGKNRGSTNYELVGPYLRGSEFLLIANYDFF